MNLTYKRMLHLFLVFCFLALLVWLFLAWRESRDPEKAYRRFCTSTDLPEIMLKDPLILAGDNVVPLVIEAVKDRSQPRRAYAILFLGHAEADDALPTLRNILWDETESDDFRAVALRAIAMIDLAEGQAAARNLEGDNGLLGSTAQDVISEDEATLKRRTYWDALFMQGE